MAYTGFRIRPTLKKVTNDANEFPLDANNQLCSSSGQPQDIKPNLSSDPTYRQSDVVCNAITYYSVAKTQDFLKDCGETEYSNNVPFSVTTGQFTSLISQEDADNKADDFLRLNGQANANSTGVCSATYRNEAEVRIYYSQSCGAGSFPEPYEHSLAANTFSDVNPDVVIASVNNYFDTTGQSSANSSGVCVVPDQEIIVYRTTGDPCTSQRTAIKLYYKALDNKYYTNPSKTVLANFYIFPEDNVLSGFKQIISGVMSNEVAYAACAPPAVIRYKDMGTPADISVYNNILLACYPDKHVVIKYDLSTGTNPVGTIVAGELNKVCTAPAYFPDPMYRYLNTPLLVQWREDGEKFAVYSGGIFKTIKIFTSGGTFYKSTDFTNTPSDSQWAYNTPVDESNYYSVPSSTTSLVGLITAQTTDLNNFWLPVSMEFGKSDFIGENNDTETNTIFLGLWNKDTANNNKFKIYSVSIYAYSGGSDNSQTNLIHTDNGFVTAGFDLIRAIKLIKTTYIASTSVTYKLAVVTPYAISKSKANDKKRFYDLHYVDVNVQRADTTFSQPIVSVSVPLTYINSYRINASTNGIWKNNVKAELVVRNSTLVVLVKSSSDSFWNILKRTAAASSIGAAVGGLALLTSGVAAGWLTNASVIGFLGFTPGGIIIGALIIAAIVIFSPPPQRYLGGSALVITYSGTAISTITYTSGSYSQSSWITNKTDRARTIYFNSSIFGTDLTIYSMAEGRIIKIGNWNANTASSQVTI